MKVYIVWEDWGTPDQCVHDICDTRDVAHQVLRARVTKLRVAYPTIPVDAEDWFIQEFTVTTKSHLST